MRSKLRARIFAPARDPLWSAVAAVLVALIISFAAIAASGRDPVTGFLDVLSGALGGPGPLGETAIKSAVAGTSPGKGRNSCVSIPCPTTRTLGTASGNELGVAVKTRSSHQRA